MTDPAERALRVDLAAAYRLVAMFGWDDLVFTHISARLPGAGHRFLINPYGALFEEITASSLVEVDLDGTRLSGDAPVNPAGFVIHSAIHAARPDVGCVLHTHTRSGVAVSAQRAGLLPISQQASIALGSLGYHDYEGIAVRDEEKPSLVAALGDRRALVLRNHGLLTVGASVSDAFLTMYTLEAACQIQVLAQSGGAELTQISQAVLYGVGANIRTVTKGMGSGLTWPALLRRLERRLPGFAD